MISALKKLFGSNNTEFSHLMKEGAIILDVRTEGEFARGHIEGAMNIPVDDLNKKVHLIKDKNKNIITCCASGRRSAFAVNILKLNGFSNVYDGGGWQNLKNKIQ